MAIGIQKNTTIIGVEEEVTEGTYVAPSGVNSFVQPLEDGFDLTPAKELVERTILTSSVGNPTPRVGTKSVAATLPVEFRGSGTEGAAPDFDSFLKGALGDVRTVASQFTTDTGHSSSVLNVTAHPFTVGDVIVILESGSHHAAAIKAQTAGTITISPAASFTPSDSVVIAKSRTYFPANTGHPALSLSYFWGNEIRQTAIGTKVTTLSLDGFSTGGIASWNFGLEGLTFDEIDGAAPFTPAFDSGLPPIILSACVSQNDTNLDVNEFTFSLENALGFLTSTCNANGRISSRVTGRAITGSLNPYKDDTTVTQHTFFNDNTEYSIFAFAANPSAVAGEFVLGSVVGIYMPKVLTVEKAVADQEGVLTDAINFQATRGESGNDDEIFIGVI